MSIPRTVAEVLNNHVTFELEGIDRMYGERVAKVADYITKPFMPSQLRDSVVAALT